MSLVCTRGVRVSLPLLAELKRRRVFRALVGYGLASFAVLQISEPIMHGLHWPESVLSYVVVALALGFPIVVGLAWIFDVNAGGIERTRSASPLTVPNRARVVLVLAGIGLLAAAPGLTWYFLWRGRDRTSADPARAASVAVLPFVNLSGDKDNDFSRCHQRARLRLGHRRAGAQAGHRVEARIRDGSPVVRGSPLAKGRLPESRAEAGRARQLDPASPIVNHILAVVLFSSRDYDRSVEQSMKTLELDPTFQPGRAFLAIGHLHAGRIAEAMAVLEGTSTTSVLQPVRVQVLAARGDRTEAQRLLAEAEGRAAAWYPRGALAAAHLALGEKEKAFAWLEKGVEGKDSLLPMTIKWSLTWDPIRSDPRFQKLRQRMNLD